MPELDRLARERHSAVVAMYQSRGLPVPDFVGSAEWDRSFGMVVREKESPTTLERVERLAQERKAALRRQGWPRRAVPKQETI